MCLFESLQAISIKCKELVCQLSIRCQCRYWKLFNLSKAIIESITESIVRLIVLTRQSALEGVPSY